MAASLRTSLWVKQTQMLCLMLIKMLVISFVRDQTHNWRLKKKPKTQAFGEVDCTMYACRINIQILVFFIFVLILPFYLLWEQDVMFKLMDVW